MNEKEIAELRRRFRPDKSAIAAVRGCCVNENGEIVSRFRQSLGLMSDEESEQLLALLRKSLSGAPGKNLIDIEFATQQVISGDEHRLLMALRSSLDDEAAVEAFYSRATAALDIEGSYMLLLAADTYDVPYRAKDSQALPDAGADVFSYIICAVCPLKPTKPSLSYLASEERFQNIAADCVVAPPELGFMFPAFDDRCTNIYGALYYTRDIAAERDAFIDAVFHTPAPMPAAVQKETFQTVLSEAVAEDCSLSVVQAVHEQLRDMIAEHKESRESEPLRVGKRRVGQLLRDCGVSEEHVAAFDEQYDEKFGADTELSPANVVDVKQIEVATPDVSIRVNPERSELVQTRVIDGRRYILIRAEEGVELNGVPVRIDER